MAPASEQKEKPTKKELVMPAQTIWMIRISLVYLLASAIMGALILTNKAFPLHPAIWSLLPVHYEMAIWGWMVQFVMGTAYWMFPRFLTGLRRGPAWAGWIVVLLYNLGLLLLLISAATSASTISMFAVAGRGLLMVSILFFAGLIWNRIVSFRKH